MSVSEKILIGLILVLCFLINTSLAQKNIVILEMFGVRDDYKHISSGDTCWVLTVDSAETYELLRTPVGLDTFTNYSPWDNDYYLDWRFTTTYLNPSQHRIMIFTGLKNLAEGKVETASEFRGIVRDSLRLNLDDSKFILTASIERITGTAEISDARGPTGFMHDYEYLEYHLHLQDLDDFSPQRQEVILAGNTYDGGLYNGHLSGNLPVLMWSGDLDQDQKVDLILMDAPDTYDQCYTLYLSSLASDSLMVRKAGSILDPCGE